jgi:hypothetical protein
MPQTHRPQWLDYLTVCGQLFIFKLKYSKVLRYRLISSSTMGYDGSMMNGLQSLPQWESAFGFPTGGKLGLLNAIQVFKGSIASVSELSSSKSYIEHRCSRGLPFCTIPIGWCWTSKHYSRWRCYHVHCYCNSNSCPIRRHVHWCSVSIIPNSFARFANHNGSFLIGFGLTFAANASPMLVTEISYPTYRAPLTSLYNSLWYSGNIV